MEQDVYYMKRALQLAKKGCGFTNPNPMVGAVLVKEGEIIGEGFHEKYGEGHAEVNAFKHATKNPEGATIYVTLEPCSHYGKTPPCADLIIRNKVARVVIGTLDPNPLVAGHGVEKLQQAGIEVVFGILEKECMELNHIFMKYIQHKQPYVLLKTAMTLDGKIATVMGESQWISCETSRRQVHELRNQYMAIMVGINTVQMDNPNLTCRLPEMSNCEQPIRIVVDSRLSISEDAAVLKQQELAKTIIAIAKAMDEKKKDRLLKRGIEILEVPQFEGTKWSVDLKTLVQRLGEMEIDSILVEGGATLAFSMIEQKIVDEVVTYVAPKIIGGEQAKTPIGGKGIGWLQDAVRLERLSCEVVGQDLCIRGKVVK